MAGGATVLLLLIICTALAFGAASASCCPLTELTKRMPEWVGKVPYSHLVNKSWGYPTDCSGFVSWALQAGTDIKAFEFGAKAYATRIPTDELQHGDIITHVWDDSPLRRCTKGHVDDNDRDDATGALLSGPDGDPPGLYISGHVFFFDRWADEGNRTHFWAYESTETEDQTAACLAQTGPFTRSMCFNHHVLKARNKTADKWSRDNCTDPKHGAVTGGPHRLVPALLCPPSALPHPTPPPQLVPYNFSATTAVPNFHGCVDPNATALPCTWSISAVAVWPRACRTQALLTSARCCVSCGVGRDRLRVQTATNR